MPPTISLEAGTEHVNRMRALIEVQRPLATEVVGGMLIGPLFLLLVVPALRLVVLRCISRRTAG